MNILRDPDQGPSNRELVELYKATNKIPRERRTLEVRELSVERKIFRQTDKRHVRSFGLSIDPSSNY